MEYISKGYKYTLYWGYKTLVDICKLRGKFGPLRAVKTLWSCTIKWVSLGVRGGWECGYTRCLSILRRESVVKSNVPILFTRSAPRQFIKRGVPMLFIYRTVPLLFIHRGLREEALKVTGLYTRSRVFESFKSDCQSEPCGKIGDGRR